jgi:hypothetical protein
MIFFLVVFASGGYPALSHVIEADNLFLPRLILKYDFFFKVNAG